MLHLPWVLSSTNLRRDKTKAIVPSLYTLGIFPTGQPAPWRFLNLYAKMFAALLMAYNILSSTFRPHFSGSNEHIHTIHVVSSNHFDGGCKIGGFVNDERSCLILGLTPSTVQWQVQYQFPSWVGGSALD